MSVTGRFGCCCGGCGFLGAHIRRTFPGWRKPLPEDFGEWIINSGCTSEELGAWVNRSAAYAMSDLPYYDNPESWGPTCTKYQPIRFLAIQVSELGSYADFSTPEPTIVNYSYVYAAERKKELWFTDESGRTGIATEVYDIPGRATPLYEFTRNETTGAQDHSGEYDDINDVVNDGFHPPYQFTIYSYDMEGWRVNNLPGGQARMTVSEILYNDLPAVKIEREISNPVQLNDSLTALQVSRQTIIFYKPLTFAEFESWLGTMLDEVKLDTPLHEYAAGLLYASPGGFNATASTLLEWMRDYEPFYTSQIDVWPNRVAINADKSVLWFDARWMPVAALRHTIGDGLQLLRRRINSPTAACLLSYEYAAPPEDIWVGLGYGDTCPVAPEVSGALKTGDYILEAGGHAGGNRVFTPADIAYENGILFIGLQQVGSTPVVGVDNMPLDTSSRPCLPLGGEYPPGSPLPPWNDGMPMSLDTETFLEEAAEIEAGCYP